MVASNKNGTNISNVTKAINNINQDLVKNGVNKEKANTANEINRVVNKINNNKNTNIPEIRNIHVNKKDLFKPIGILDVDAQGLNPLTGEPYSELTSSGEKYSDFFKVCTTICCDSLYKRREEVIRDIYENQVILVEAGTGSGKTVLIPKFTLHAMNYQGRIAITNPKRKPSKSNADFAALCMDTKLGEGVGVKYRGSNPAWYSKKSKLVYCTDGYVGARLRADNLLSDYDAVVIDEAHERGIQIDLLLVTLKDLVIKRPDFKLIIMSATVNPEIFINYFPSTQFKFKHVIAAAKPNYPVKAIYLERPINKFNAAGNLTNNAYIEKAAEVAKDIITTTEKGDVLIFVTGKGDSQKVCTCLHLLIGKINKNKNATIWCQTLTSSTPENITVLIKNIEKYKTEATGAPYERKVIVATEVAESSITFENIDFVIDSGLVNQATYYYRKNMEALEVRNISLASHKQRLGRTGRIGPGTCYNLFTVEEEKKFPAFTKPSILLENTGELILSFFARPDLIKEIILPFSYKNIKKTKLGEAPPNLASFLNTLIERPAEEAVAVEITRLLLLGAVEIKEGVGRVSDLGRAMAKFGVIPELARALIGGYNYGCRDEICALAAIMMASSYREDLIFQRYEKPKTKNLKLIEAESARYKKIKKKWANAMGEHFSLLDIYHQFRLHKYDRIDKRTGEITRHKLGNTKEWCRDNYLNYRTLEKVNYELKELCRKFGQIRREEMNKGKDGRVLFLSEPPSLSEKREDNVLSALLTGYFINLAVSNGRMYKNCLPPDKTVAGISRFSLFDAVRSKSKYVFYSLLRKILIRTEYAMVSKIPPKLMESFKTDPRRNYVLKQCSTTNTRPEKKKSKWTKKGPKKKGRKDRKGRKRQRK